MPMTLGRFDDDHRGREAADQAVPAGEILRLGFLLQRELAQ